MGVIVIKTIGGEELLAELVKEDGYSLVVSRPRILHITQNGAGLIPYIISDPEHKEVPLRYSAIATFLPASLEMERNYNQAVSGLVLNERM